MPSLFDAFDGMNQPQRQGSAMPPDAPMFVERISDQAALRIGNVPLRNRVAVKNAESVKTDDPAASSAISWQAGASRSPAG